MDKKTMIWRLKEFAKSFSFVVDSNDKTLETIIDDILRSLDYKNRTDYDVLYIEVLSIIKKEIVKKVKTQYASDRNNLFRKLIKFKLNDQDITIERKLKIISVIFKICGDGVDKDYCRELLGRYIELQTFLGNVFQFCDDKNQDIYENLIEKYPKLKPLFDEYFVVKKKNYTTEVKEEDSNVILTNEEVRDLYARMYQGDNSCRALLLTHNLNLVKKYANYYHLKAEDNMRVEFDDLFQEGVLGLENAIDRFDINRNIQFSTYAVKWITCYIIRYIKGYSRVIKVPAHKIEWMLSLKSQIAKLQEKYGRTLEYSEIEKELGISKSELSTFHQLSKNVDSLNRVYKSKDGSKDGDELGITIKDTSQDTEQTALKNLLEEELMDIINNGLSSTYASVLKMRCGLDGREEKTLSYVGEKLGVSRQRVAQIEAESKKILKAMLGDKEQTDIPLAKKKRYNKYKR